MHLSRSASILTATAAAATLVVGVPTTASAQSWTHADPAGDVSKVVSDTDSESEEPSPSVVDPTVTDHDVVSTTVRHNPRKVIATVRMRDLTAPANGLDLLVLALRTPHGTRQVLVFTDPYDARGSHEVWGPRGGDRRCRGLRHHLDYAADTATVSVPRSCIGRPRWVRAHVQAIRVVTTSDSVGVGWAARKTARQALAAANGTVDPTDPSISTQYDDNAFSSRPGDLPAYSPRLRRG